MSGPSSSNAAWNSSPSWRGDSGQMSARDGTAASSSSTVSWVSSRREKSEGVCPPAPGPSVCAARPPSAVSQSWPSRCTASSSRSSPGQLRVRVRAGPSGPSWTTAPASRACRAGMVASTEPPSAASPAICQGAAVSGAAPAVNRPR